MSFQLQPELINHTDNEMAKMYASNYYSRNPYAENNME